MNYYEYLQSEEWQAMRAAAMRYYDNRCALCNGRDSLHVHHRTYERLGQERVNDLIVLCDSCHSRHHGVLPTWSGWLGRVSSDIFSGVRW